jgi:hypothetical protein
MKNRNGYARKEPAPAVAKEIFFRTSLLHYFFDAAIQIFWNFLFPSVAGAAPHLAPPPHERRRERAFPHANPLACGGGIKRE